MADSGEREAPEKEEEHTAEIEDQTTGNDRETAPVKEEQDGQPAAAQSDEKETSAEEDTLQENHEEADKEDASAAKTEEDDGVESKEDGGTDDVTTKDEQAKEEVEVDSKLEDGIRVTGGDGEDVGEGGEAAADYPEEPEQTKDELVPEAEDTGDEITETQHKAGLEEDDTGPPQEQQTQEEPTPKTEELVAEVKEEVVLPSQEEATQPKVPAQETDVEMPRQNSVADERPSSGERSSKMSGIETPRESDVSPNALNLTWAFGINKHVPTVNLTDPHRNVILYVCGNTAVLYDFTKNTQKLLQGHSNNITCTCASQDKRWVATADKGPGSMIIIWDSFTGTPVQTIFDAHPDVGVVAMAMTPDAKYIVSLSASHRQTLCIWDWTVNGELPVVATELPEGSELQTYVIFNPDDMTQIVSNSTGQVIFYEWKGANIRYVAPELTDQDFNRMVGNYSQSIFCANSTKALTATSVGNVVVWDNVRPVHGPPITTPSPKKKAFKLVRLQERGIMVLTTTDSYVVTGDVNGHVRFYDNQLTMLNWYSEFNVGPLNAISFEYKPNFIPVAKEDSNYPADSTIAARAFITRNYTISTSTAQVANVISDGSVVSMILDEHDAAIHGLASHPIEPWIAIGSYSGLLQVWNYQEKCLVVSRKFNRGQMIRCISYDPKGNYLGVGFTNGSVRILDSLTLEDECPEPFRYSRDAVTHCVFSHDSSWFATGDADFCVTVYKAAKPTSEWPWTYLGKYQAHYKPIRTVTFGVALDSDLPRLLSLGEDRALVEYDLGKSSIDDLKLLATERIEQSAVPQCLAWYPPVTKEQFYLTANDQFKFKLYNTTTTMCRYTLLAPTYGTPIQKMEVLPSKDALRDTKRYMAYITTDKIGLIILPLDGNPHNAMALIAHPSGVTNLACSNDGRYVFSAGGTDATLLMWGVNIIALEAGAKLGGEDLIPFYGLLDGGREGELFKELENYFYYAQIRSQGVDTMDTREVSVTIPISEIPFVMRAMGHYPSEQEVEDMINEVKFSKYVDSGKYIDKIDLGDFIKLYVNHRPAFGLSISHLTRAFEVLGCEEDSSIDRGDLLHWLQHKGEHLTENELAEYITTLLGLNPEGGSSELGGYDAVGSSDLIEEYLPDRISAEHFSSEVLGFSLTTEDQEITSPE